MFASLTRTRSGAPVLGIVATAMSFWVGITSASCSKETSIPAKPPSPTIVIEAIVTNHSIGDYRDSMLLARLTDDGKVEWDRFSATATGHEYLREVSKLDLQRVASIRRELGATDLQNIQAKMRPYNMFVDTSYEIFVRIPATLTGELKFSVINPWCNKSITCIPSKPLPRNLESILCQAELLRAEVAHEPTEDSCDAERKAPK